MGLVFEEESYQIRGAAFAVYDEMGPGFLEAVYQECLALEFTERSIPFEPEPRVSLRYRGHNLEAWYQPDFICFESIILEIKAVEQVARAHLAQTLNYLKATNMKLGLLINFGAKTGAEIKRVVR